MNQPAGPAVDERKRGRDKRVIWSLKATLLSKCEAQHHACLAVVGQALAGGAVDQGIEVGDSAQYLSCDGDREPVVGGR